MSYFLFQIEWVFWVYLLCAGAVKLHHYLGLGAVTISTGGNSHLSTVIVPARGGIGVPTHFSEPWTVIGITELLLGAIICLSGNASGNEYFSSTTESEGRGLARADILGLSQGGPTPSVPTLNSQKNSE